MPRRHLFECVAFVVCFFAGTCLSAEPADLSGRATALFDTWDKPSESNYQDARRQFAELENIAPSDSRIPYAMALIAVQNHRMSDASALLEEANAGGKGRMSMRQAQIWVNAARNDFPNVARELRSLASDLKSDQKSANSAAATTAEWMGRMVGFLSGPGSEGIKPSDVASLEADVKSKLPALLSAAFDSGKDAAASRFRELTEQQTKAREEAKTQNAQKRDQEKKQNDAALADATKRREAAEHAVDDYQKQVVKDMETDTKQVKKLEKDAVQKEHQLYRHGRAMEKAGADGANARGINAAANQEVGKLQSLQNEVKRLRLLERGLTLKSDELAKPLSDKPPTAIDGKITSMSSYADFDLDAEKGALLSSFSKK
jgi:hypothetical protein